MGTEGTVSFPRSSSLWASDQCQHWAQQYHPPPARDMPSSNWMRGSRSAVSPPRGAGPAPVDTARRARRPGVQSLLGGSLSPPRPAVPAGRWGPASPSHVRPGTRHVTAVATGTGTAPKLPDDADPAPSAGHPAAGGGSPEAAGPWLPSVALKPSHGDLGTTDPSPHWCVADTPKFVTPFPRVTRSPDS